MRTGEKREENTRCALVSQNAFIHIRVSVDDHHSFNSPPSVIMAEAVELPVERAVFIEYSFFLLIIYHESVHLHPKSRLFVRRRNVDLKPTVEPIKSLFALMS